MRIIPRHTFARLYKIPDLKGKIDYISNPQRQEHLFATYDTAVDERFWDYLAGENQKDFMASGASGKCIEAREWVIALPESFKEYDPQLLLKLFVDRFVSEYGLNCSAALHLNKAKTNYHIHMIFSERKSLDKTDVKVATRARYYDENGKYHRIKKDVLDENGNLRKGCYVIKKGETYDVNFFAPKEEFVKSSQFVADVKAMYTEMINALVKDEKEKLTVFDSNGPYLATKKIGKNNPMTDEIKADNDKRMEWNRTVDEARVSGIAEDDVIAVKKEEIDDKIVSSIRKFGNRPEKLGTILKQAIAILKDKINLNRFKEKTEIKVDLKEWNSMQRTYKKLVDIKKQIIYFDEKIEYKQKRISELPAIGYKKFKITLIKEEAELIVKRQSKSQELGEIIKNAGYKNVSSFMKAYEKARKTVEEYSSNSETDKKESVVAKLKSYEAEAKTGKKENIHKTEER